VHIVVGHANPDFDAYASTVAATKLFPGARGVFLGTQNTNVRAFHNLHEEFLDFVDLRGLDLDAIDHLTLVDTRDPDRIGELGAVAERLPCDAVVVYDHHPPQEGDLTGVDDRSIPTGATTSILVHEIRARGIALAPLEASLMLLGIHEDTGSLTYPGTTAYDADAAAWLMATGADLEVVNQFLARALDDRQRDLLRQLESTLEIWDANGQQVAVGTAVSDEYVDSASVLTHYVVEDMGYRVAIALVQMPERLQVVARSRLADVDVGAVMARIGGGGHAQAASAGFRDLALPEALARVRSALEAVVRPPLRAADIASFPVRSISPEATMREAAELMARWGHGGMPVCDADGALVGMVTRKDVDKAMRHGLDHAPAKGFMTRDVVTASPGTDLYDLERLLATRGIGRVPIVDESGTMVGIVTRKDVLRAEHGDAYLDRGLSAPHAAERERFLTSLAQLLPGEVSDALRTVGEIAAVEEVRAHVVGGFVRDMLLGRPNLDVDVVVEGDGIGFAEAAARALGARVKVHRRFGTAVIVVSRGFHIDVATARSEYYTRPGALPTVERSGLRQDLLRRDFTVNAMAACIDPTCLGAIADPFGGLSDLSGAVVRVLHSMSFIEDPTRVLRAARFEIRYGFRLDPVSERLARDAVTMCVLDEVGGARIREELVDITDESDPAAVFARLADIGALAQLVPDGVSQAAAVAHVTDTLAALSGPLAGVRGVRRRHAIVAALSAGAKWPAADRWIRHVRWGREYAAVIAALAQRGPAALRALRNRRSMRDSRLFHILSPLPVEMLPVLWALGDDRARDRIERFARELATVRPAVTGRDLIELGAEPSHAFSAILAQARDDRLDGRAVGRDAELANLRRLAEKAGALLPREDSA